MWCERIHFKKFHLPKRKSKDRVCCPRRNIVVNRLYIEFKPILKFAEEENETIDFIDRDLITTTLRGWGSMTYDENKR